MRRGVVFTALLLGALNVHAQSDVVTLDGAIAAARANNRSLANARLEVQKAQAAETIVAAKRFPKVELTALANQPLTRLNFEFKRGVFGSYANVGPLPGEDTKVNLARTFSVIGFMRVTQPLSQLYDISLGRRIAQLETNIQRSQLRDADEEVRAEVKRAYYTMQQLQSARVAVDESVRLLQELQRVVRQYVAQQVALQSDALEVDARLVRAQSERMKIAHAIESDREQLNLLMGRPLDTPIEVIPFVAPHASSNAVTADASSEVTTARLRVQQARTDMRLKRADFYPDVALLGTYLAPTNFDLLPKNIASAAIVATWDPFTWGARRAELAQKAKNLEEAQNAERETRDRIQLAINAQRRLIDERAADIEVRSAEQRTAAEKLRVVTEKYKHDAVLLREVLTAETAVAEANHGVDEARVAWATALADLEKLTGE